MTIDTVSLIIALLDTLVIGIWIGIWISGHKRDED